MYKNLKFHIRGVSPLLVHNGQLADPLNKYARDMKAISGKRKKTDDDYEALGKIEFFGGLYLDEKIRPVIPGGNLESMLVEAGKKQKLGEPFKAGVISDGLWIIEYDGPKTVEDLWKDKRFVDRRGVKIGTSTVIRTRPIFRSWSLKFTIDYLPDLLNESNVIDAVTTAGRIIGLGNYTPKFGRFEIV
jgi:hypothetical protein